MKLTLIALGLTAVALSSGCSSLGVEPWQRDLLARKDMQPGGSRREH